MEPPAGVVDRTDVEANGADEREHSGDPGHHRRSLPAVPSTVSSIHKLVGKPKHKIRSPLALHASQVQSFRATLL